MAAYTWLPAHFKASFQFDLNKIGYYHYKRIIVMLLAPRRPIDYFVVHAKLEKLLQLEITYLMSC